MRGVIHHLVLTVQDPERSCAFYDAVLSALGYERKEARGFDWYLKSPLGVHSLHVVDAILEADDLRPVTESWRK